MQYIDNTKKKLKLFKDSERNKFRKTQCNFSSSYSYLTKQLRILFVNASLTVKLNVT